MTEKEMQEHTFKELQNLPRVVKAWKHKNPESVIP